MLSSSTIDAVRELNIEDVIGYFITLKKAGSKYKACCPIHNEKTPSFVVDPVKNSFHCYGCGEGGDGIAFVMANEKVDFIEAVKIIASKEGIDIKESEEKGKTQEEYNEEKIFLNLLQQASSIYKSHVSDQEAYLMSDSKRPFTRYFDNTESLPGSRRLTRESIIEWQIGYVHDWKVITPEIIKNNFFAIGEKFGLIRKSESGNVYDFFHHRITLPIHNPSGQLIGFGGRIKPGEEGAKYFNAAESSIYHKSKTLYGFHKARKHFDKHGGALLVEGYFDVIKPHQRSWENAIGTCGTALTEEMAKLIKRCTDNVYVMRDGDKAGRKAMERDIPILVAAQLNVIIIPLPEKEDPDTLFNSTWERIVSVCWNWSDGIEWMCDKFLMDGLLNPSAMAAAIEKCVALLALIDNQVKREQYIKKIASLKPKVYGLKIADLAKPIDKLYQRQQAVREAADEDSELSKLPEWVNTKDLMLNGFCQLTAHTKGFRAGIYVNEGKLLQVTNFSIKALYHINDPSNNRRLVEVDNGDRNSVVEMPSNALVNQAAFENALVDKGHYLTQHTFTKKHFKLITNWLGYRSPLASELKNLGYQPEGFFAFSNAVYHNGELINYDDLGMIKVDDKFFMSLANSRLHADQRAGENPYENDSYLKYVPAPAGFDISKWTNLFSIAFGDNAPFGIAIVFVTLFKDIVTRTAKMPMLYCYGPKGSGKSAMAESITWLFFSGQNSKNELIKGFNLNQGQSTQFSFYNRMERFYNCPILLNEFDENVIEDWKFGTLKAAYDGEGREVGDGSTGKARKTKIQPVNGVPIIVGQYLSVKDDGSVLSRSITCSFSLERMTNLNADQIKAYEDLHKAEKAGLSSVLMELLKLRPEVSKNFAKEFSIQQTRMMAETRNDGHRVEARLISNYSLMVAATKIMIDLGIPLPYSFEDFFKVCKARVISHNKLLKDNNAIHQFWKTVATLFDIGSVRPGFEVIVRSVNHITIKGDGKVYTKQFATWTNVLLMRFDNVYSFYSKHYREREGKPALNDESLLLYLREQPYFIGLTPNETFKDKRTSAYVFNYDALLEMNIVLEKNQDEAPAQKEPAPPVNGQSPQIPNDDIPF